MIPRVINASLLNEYNIYIEFDDGANGTVDFMPILESDPCPVIRDLLDKDLFKTAKVDLHTLRWNNDADFCPVVLRELVGAADADMQTRMEAFNRLNGLLVGHDVDLDKLKAERLARQ